MATLKEDQKIAKLNELIKSNVETKESRKPQPASPAKTQLAVERHTICLYPEDEAFIRSIKRNADDKGISFNKSQAIRFALRFVGSNQPVEAYKEILAMDSRRKDTL